MISSATCVSGFISLPPGNLSLQVTITAKTFFSFFPSEKQQRRLPVPSKLRNLSSVDVISNSALLWKLK